MQYIPRIMKTNMRLHHSIQHNKMECRRLGLSTFWCVDVLACRRFGLSTFWSVDVLVCRRFGLSTFWFVDVLVCRRFGLSTFRFVDVSVCRRFGCRRFGLSTFWPVTINIIFVKHSLQLSTLTHREWWVRVTRIYAPSRHKSIILFNSAPLSIGHLGTHFN